jgi:glycosyltransferase involved in cell wall biosynthesis
LKDLIEDHKTGMLVNPADVDSLADAMLSIADDCRLRQQIVGEASAWVLSKHSLPQWIREIVNVYKKAELS